MCIRRQPVGRKERISSTLERRSSCHFRICRGISLFLPLSSQRRVRRSPVICPFATACSWLSRAPSLLPKQRPRSHQSSCPSSLQGSRRSSVPIDPRMDRRRLIDSLDSFSARAPLPVLLWTRGGKNNTFKCNEVPFTAPRQGRGGRKAPGSKLKCGK